MLPSSLKSIYQQYKADTDSVATWLATTAKENGFTSDAPRSNNPPATSGRPKGKARKQAKAAGQLPPSPIGRGSKGNHVIRIKDFEIMASYVAKIESIRVPDQLATALERVIWVRKTFSERLAASGARINAASDGRHSYFVGVLEKVRDYLKPFMKPGTFDTDGYKIPGQKKSADRFKSMFDVLDVYTPSQDFLNAPDVAVPKTTPDAEFTLEKEDTFDEAIFGLVALLSDYRRLGDEVRNLWTRYVSGQLDLAAAAVATNTAFELARSMEDEVKPLLNKNEGPTQLVNECFLSLCEASGIDRDRKKRPEDPWNLDAYELGKHCLLNAVTLIGSYAGGNADADYIVNNYNGKFGWYDEELGASGQTNRAKFNQDVSALMENFPDLEFLSSHSGRGAVEDELIRGLGALMKTENPQLNVSLWLAWAMQTYLDVLQRLGADCGRPYEEMQQESLKIQKAMLQVPASSQERNRVLAVATKWDTDPIWTCRDAMIRLGQLADANPPPYKFLRRNPIHCGLLLHNMRATLHTSGLQYAAPPGSLMATVQLYHALRQEKLLKEQDVWDDLEKLWKMQGNSAFFVGDPPTDREAYFRNYCLSIGVSASNWAPTKRKGKPNVNKDNRRNLKYHGWVSLMLERRLAPTGERPALSSDFIDGILKEGRRQETLDGKGHLRPDVKKKSGNEMPENETISPAQLISKLAAELHREVPDITFNYFTMHHTAWSLLTKLKEEFTRLVGASFLQYIPSEANLPFLVGYTFSTAAGRMGVRPNEVGEPNLRFMESSAKVLHKFLEAGHGRTIQQNATTKVEPEEVADLEFKGPEQWKINELMAGIKRQAELNGGLGALEAMGGRDCPMQ